MRWRKFLEPAKTETDSYVVVFIPKSDDESINLKIADCSRSVSLWFSVSSSDSIQRSLNKLAVLETALDKVRKNIESRRK